MVRMLIQISWGRTLPSHMSEQRTNLPNCPGLTSPREELFSSPLTYVGSADKSTEWPIRGSEGLPRLAWRVVDVALCVSDRGGTPVCCTDPRFPRRPRCALDRLG